MRRLPHPLVNGPCVAASPEQRPRVLWIELKHERDDLSRAKTICRGLKGQLVTAPKMQPCSFSPEQNGPLCAYTIPAQANVINQTWAGEDTPAHVWWPRGSIFTSVGDMVRYSRFISNSMVGKRYRLNTPALAIINHEGQRFRMTIPLGDVIQVLNGPLDEEWLLDVEWKGKALTIFANDLREHGELVEGLGTDGDRV